MARAKEDVQGVEKESTSAVRECSVTREELLANNVSVKFECRMLQRLEVEGGDQKWKTMSYEDEDDFEALQKIELPSDSLGEGCRVAIWRAGAKSPDFVRMGTVRVGWRGGVTRSAEKVTLS